VTAIDWRNYTGKSYVNPVKDQGQCGSCWAFAAISVIESRYAIKSGSLYSLSEQQFVDCAGGVYENNGCGGGMAYAAIEYAQDFGVMEEEKYPYVAKDQNCTYIESEVQV